MNIKRYSIIKANHGGRLFHGGNFFSGELVVMFPRALFVCKESDGKKSFLNAYMRLNDLQHYREFDDLRKDIKKTWGINPDTFNQVKKIWRH